MLINRLKLAFLIMFFVFGLNACASKGLNLVKSGDVKVKVESSGLVKITNVRVKQLENEVLIHADARPVNPVRFFHPGHLSFELFTADGHQYFNLDVTRYSRQHADSQRSALKHVSFWVRMPLDIPKGSILKVIHHKKSVHEKEMK